MLGLDRGIAAGFYRRNERIGMPIVTVPGRRRQLRQEPTISVVCRAAHGFLRSTAAQHDNCLILCLQASEMLRRAIQSPQLF
jgi:hypothetical protein